MDEWLPRCPDESDPPPHGPPLPDVRLELKTLDPGSPRETRQGAQPAATLPSWQVTHSGRYLCAMARAPRAWGYGIRSARRTVPMVGFLAGCVGAMWEGAPHLRMHTDNRRWDFSTRESGPDETIRDASP